MSHQFVSILQKTSDTKIFGDFNFTQNYPYHGLQAISKDTDHAVHIMIQSHLTFLDPDNIHQAVYQALNTPT